MDCNEARSGATREVDRDKSLRKKNSSLLGDTRTLKRILSSLGVLATRSSGEVGHEELCIASLSTRDSLMSNVAPNAGSTEESKAEASHLSVLPRTDTGC